MQPQLSQRPLISVERLPDMPSKQAVAKYLQDISPPAPKRASTATLGAPTSTGNLVSFRLHISTLYLYTIRIIHTNKKHLIHLLLLFFQEIIPIQSQVSTTPDVSTPPMIPTTGASTASMRKKPVTEVSHFLNTCPFLYLNIFQIDKVNNFVHIKNKLIYFSPQLYLFAEEKIQMQEMYAVQWSLIVMEKHCKVHSEDKILECQVCSKVYDDQDHLDEHEDSHVNDSRYTCMVKLNNNQICGKKAALGIISKMHIRSSST